MSAATNPVSGLPSSPILEALCARVRFEPGDVLRHYGQHYRDMYLLVSGSVVIDREVNGRPASPVVVGAGAPIGEIGFLRGTAATATVTARTLTEALVIDDRTLARLEEEQPRLTADLMRHLARVAEERTSVNLTVDTATPGYAGMRGVEVCLCRTEQMLESARRLRYEVYCQELGRQSPYANHETRIIADDLDVRGYTFIAVEDGETTGTLRANVAAEGSLGVLEELYGMRLSPHHPAATVICTKFIVKKAKRGGQTSFKLIAAVVTMGMRERMRECYIDCIPRLLPYYRALGFTPVGPAFMHRENGPSQPMVLNLARHGARLSQGGGVRSYIRLIVVAQAWKIVHWVRECTTTEPSHERR